MNPFSIAKLVAGVAALFGGALVLKEAKETVEVVPKTVGKLESFMLPITIIAGVFLVKALKSK